MSDDKMFWADQLANAITNKKKFNYINKPVPKLKEFTVKTSASLSGVLHIGRLSDTIRSESVHRALLDSGAKSKIIWVAEDMDPLRKVPKGVPKNYEKYIGMPVTDIPDPDGCHDSYAAHHVDEYFKVFHEFVTSEMETYSMREEYKQGNFNPFIKKIIENIDKVKEIQNRFRTNPLPDDWFPWSPICEKCSKIATPAITKVKDSIVEYECRDYSFEKTIAKGCGHKGENNPLKDKGKLMWKSEWAAQWARWQVSSEGAGKEYQVPNSAFWINGEIVEKALDFPMPQPIFYEHIMVDNTKMSASLGNVIYPQQWLEVAPPELLRFFYNKKLMKTRSFSWKDLPIFYDDYDNYAKVYSGKVKLDNKKDENHMKRLYEISHGKDIRQPIEMAFSHACVVAQISDKDEDIVESLEKTGHYQKDMHKEIFERIKMARGWLKLYAPEDIKFEIMKTVPKGLNLSKSQKDALKRVAKLLKEKKFTPESLHQEFYDICKEISLPPKEFFRAGYNILLNKDRGPKLASFIITIGQKKVADLFNSLN